MTLYISGDQLKSLILLGVRCLHYERVTLSMFKPDLWPFFLYLGVINLGTGNCKNSSEPRETLSGYDQLGVVVHLQLPFVLPLVGDFLGELRYGKRIAFYLRFIYPISYTFMAKVLFPL